MIFQNIVFSVDGGIGTIRMNRPKEMNSLNFELLDELRSAFSECEQRDDVRVVVLTGVGQVFSAGDDIKIMKVAEGKTAAEIADIIEISGYPSLVKKMMALGKPIVASVNGICFGAGGELALACDHVIASDKASFGQLYIALGLIGNTFLLPRHVGAKKALELIWSGEVLGAEEALRIGMVNQVVEDAQLERKTVEKAARLAAGPTLAYAYAKKAVYESATSDLDSALSRMTKAQGLLMKSDDHLEGVRAFFEKRRPCFKGK